MDKYRYYSIFRYPKLMIHHAEYKICTIFPYNPCLTSCKPLNSRILCSLDTIYRNYSKLFTFAHFTERSTLTSNVWMKSKSHWHLNTAITSYGLWNQMKLRFGECHCIACLWLELVNKHIWALSQRKSIICDCSLNTRTHVQN